MIKIERKTLELAMAKIWQWVGSPSYFKCAASITGIYLTIAALASTGDWWFTSAIALGFYFVWYYSKRAIEAAHNIK